MQALLNSKVLVYDTPYFIFNTQWLYRTSFVKSGYKFLQTQCISSIHIGKPFLKEAVLISLLGLRQCL